MNKFTHLLMVYVFRLLGIILATTLVALAVTKAQVYYYENYHIRIERAKAIAESERYNIKRGEVTSGTLSQKQDL